MSIHIPIVPDPETLARAALTYCSDGADAIMHATVMGADSALTIVELLSELRPSEVSIADGLTMQELDRLFTLGVKRWGGRCDSRSMTIFHQNVERWRARAATLPSLRSEHLSDLLTCQGGYWIIAPHSMYWPGQLNDLAIRKDWAPPLCLWGLGDPRVLTACSKPMGIVGSRGVNDYGRQVAHDLAFNACRAGNLIISGGAYGVDAAAHWGAIAASDAFGTEHSGSTVTVFAGGLNLRGPQRNEGLFDQIIAHDGALISELPPDAIPHAGRFLLRNRIIAALCSSLVVAQARLRSGALNTAHWAGELGREVYAVPGNITSPANAGCNALIEKHEAMILCSTSYTEQDAHRAHTPHADVHVIVRNDPQQSDQSENDRDERGEPAVQHCDDVEQQIMRLLRSRAHRVNHVGLQDIINALSRADTTIGDDPDRDHPSHDNSGDDHHGRATDLTARIMQTLAQLELSGRITVTDGRITRSTGSVKDQPATRHHPHSHGPGKEA